MLALQPADGAHRSGPGGVARQWATTTPPGFAGATVLRTDLAKDVGWAVGLRGPWKLKRQLHTRCRCQGLASALPLYR